MKSTFHIGLMILTVFVFSTDLLAQKKTNQAVVKFELVTDNSDSPEMAMLAGTSLDVYFNDKISRMDMSMMGGLMRIQTFAPVDKPEDGTILMDMMGQKIQIVDIPEDDLKKRNSFLNLNGLKKVTYNNEDEKKIAGYSCYGAEVEVDDNMKMKYYITEKIQAPVSKSGEVELKGFPLEMEIDTGKGFKMVFRAKEVITTVPNGSFDIPKGYTKKTLAEFEKEMGEMNFGF